MTLQSHYNMIIIKYKVKYLLYLKRLPIQTAPLGIMKPSR